MSLQLRSTVKKGIGADGTVELSLASMPIKEPEPNEVVVRIEAAPINPSDMELLLGPADLNTLQKSGTAAGPVLSAAIPAAEMSSLGGRLGKSLSAGNEGAGVVVRAGKSERAQALLGKVVGVFTATSGEMYAEYRTLRTGLCQAFPEGVTPSQAATWYINPMAALGMVETMRREGHKGLVLTAAASNLGQMLCRLCIKDGIPLVSIVSEQQMVDVLKAIGAPHIVNSSSSSFMEDLTDALVATGATLAFDAIGGGQLAGQILTCMGMASDRVTQAPFSIYGNPSPKQVYVYGGLDSGPIVIKRSPPLNMHWNMGGWLLATFMGKIGAADARQLRERVAAEILTTFASSHSKEISLTEILDVDVVQSFMRRVTGGKYLLCPHKGKPPALTASSASSSQVKSKL
mmetsp:Transcript_143077/g.274835  ORF Transcript_143077/g.274835 Transcript_143077/m.274835 type:complete len:403 (-) Transcript_143077:44-1252(-)